MFDPYVYLYKLLNLINVLFKNITVYQDSTKNRLAMNSLRCLHSTEFFLKEITQSIFSYIITVKVIATINGSILKSKFFFNLFVDYSLIYPYI